MFQKDADPFLILTNLAPFNLPNINLSNSTAAKIVCCREIKSKTCSLWDKSSSENTSSSSKIGLEPKIDSTKAASAVRHAFQLLLNDVHVYQVPDLIGKKISRIQVQENSIKILFWRLFLFRFDTS